MTGNLIKIKYEEVKCMDKEVDGFPYKLINAVKSEDELLPYLEAFRKYDELGDVCVVYSKREGFELRTTGRRLIVVNGGMR